VSALVLKATGRDPRLRSKSVKVEITTPEVTAAKMPDKRNGKPLPDKKGLKSMKDFLHDFFNPPKFIKPTETKKVVVKKKKKKQGPTPMQRQLMETNDFMKYKMDEFAACCTGGERVLLAYHNIPEESTTIDRLWRTELANKDSRIRRELSLQGEFPERGPRGGFGRVQRGDTLQLWKGFGAHIGSQSGLSPSNG